MSASRRLAYGFLLVFAIAIPLVGLKHQSILRAAGNYLVQSESPEKSDAVLVLAGDFGGNRIMRGAQLVQEGYAPVVLMSGPVTLYGVNEATLAIQYATRHGADPSIFEAVYNQSRSTLDEAHAFRDELQKRNAHKILLVTSNFHTRRASGIFRRVLGNGFTVRSIAAPDRFFSPDTWWHNREGQKIVFYEYSKTVADWLGL